MNKKFRLISLIMVIMIVASACSSGGGVETSKAGKKSDLIFGTAGTAGTYYIVGVAMGNAVTQKSEVNNIVVQSSLGSMENINLTSLNETQLGLSNADGVYFAYNGTGTYEKSGKQDILGVMSLYMSAGQMIAKESSGIKTYADLKGKKVCLGPPSTTIIEMSKSILKSYGIDPEKDITPFYLTFDEGVSKVVDGELDATFFVAGLPTAALMNATSTTDMTLVNADIEILESIAEEQPYYEPFVIPANTYKGIDYDVNTFKIMTQLFTNSKTTEDEIYDFVKIALEDIDSYVDAHAVLKEVTPENAAKMGIPLHPGAEKYYKEIGVIK